MRIVIDLTSLSYHMTGIERYAACITEKMLEQDIVNEYILIFRNEIYPIFNKYIDGKRVKADVLRGDKKVIFLQIILPIHLYRVRADRYLFFAFTSPVIFKKAGIYNTIHDMGAWDSAQSMTFFQKLYWQITLKSAANVSERIITVSKFSKGRITDILGYPSEKINVVNSAVYEGITQNNGCDFEDIREKYNLPNKYIMTLSTLEPRKNMETLLEAFCLIQDKVDYNLVLVGRNGWKMDEVVQRYNEKKRILITGFVKDEHVSLIYKNALCFVFPSLYEGFGLPPLEALALGTPVIASYTASIPEVLMEQAIYFKNNSKEELMRLLVNLEDNLDSMPNKLNNYQKENYTFEASAKKILEIIGA